MDHKHPEVCTQEDVWRVEPGCLFLTQGRLHGPPRASEGVDVCSLGGQPWFYFLKIIIGERFYGVGVETQYVASLYNPWDVLVLMPLHLFPGDDITPC